jgi:hypothetical protein
MKLVIIKNFKQSLKNLFHNFIPEYVKVKLYFLLDPSPKNKLRANSAIRTENYYQACKQESTKNNNHSSNNYYLHKAFKKHLVRSNLIDDRWWSDFILLINLPQGIKFQKINQSLIDKIEYYNFSSLEYFEILDIYTLCLRFSLLDLGYHLRQKSLRIALEYPISLKKNESWKLKAKLSALLETSNFSKFDQLFPLFKSLRKRDQDDLTYLREVLGNDKKPPLKNLSLSVNSEQELKFGKFVDNKKIVIVSPKPVKTKDGYKIDNADIVMRCNYKIGNFDIKGSRCDISHFNLETVMDIERNGCLEWPLDIKWIIFKTWGAMEIILKRLSLDGINVEHLNGRIIKRVDNALFNGSLTAVQNMVVDLSRHNPKEIYLYHFDVMLSKERVSGYFSDGNDDETFYSKAITCFITHDPVINFMILKFFWKQGIIKGDFCFEEVMKMEAEDYMKNLQKNYHKGNSFGIN